MELSRIQENIQTRAREVMDEAKTGLSRLEEKTQPRLTDLQKRFEEWTDLDAMIQKSGIKDTWQNFVNETKSLRERSEIWLEENYAGLLDRIGVASKDEVEALRKKLSTLQRKINKLRKSVEA